MQRGGESRGTKQGYSSLLCCDALWQEVIMNGTNVTQYPGYLRRGLGNAMGVDGNLLN